MNKEELILEKLDALTVKVDSLDKRIDLVDKKIDEKHNVLVEMLGEYAVQQTERFDAIDRRFDVIDERLDNHDVQLATLVAGQNRLTHHMEQTREGLVQQLRVVKRDQPAAI